MIKAISFDIGGTLVEVDRNSKSIIDKISQTTGIDKNKIKKIFRRNFVEKSNSVFAFCDEINFKNVSVIEHIINEHKSRSKLYPETYEVLNILSSMGYKLITISNDSCWNKKKLNKYDVTKFFVEEIYSYQYGVTKPHISLFNYAQQKLNVNSSEIMHIGDTLHSEEFTLSFCCA